MLATICIAVVALGAIAVVVVLPSLTGEAIERLYDNRYLHSAITVEESQTKGDFNITLVRVGDWTHPIHESGGTLVDDFRVDITVTCICHGSSYLWLSHFHLSDNLGGNYSWVGRNSLVLGQIFSGETRTGFVLFPALDAKAYSIMLVVTQTNDSSNIVYEFEAAL